jgi:putative aldouronate transport system permease protein
MIKHSKEDQVFNLFNYIILSIVLILICFPLINIVSRSFSSKDAVIAGRVWLWPVDFSLLGYETVFENKQVWMGYLNSIIYTVLGTAINVSLTVTAAYSLSRKDFKARGFVMTLFIITMMFNGWPDSHVYSG